MEGDAMRALLAIALVLIGLPAVANDGRISIYMGSSEDSKMSEQAYVYTDKEGITWICRWDLIPDEYKPLPRFELVKPE
jgi:hypothetical protein